MKNMKLIKKVFCRLAAKGFFNWLPDKLYLSIRYRLEFGKKLNLTQPLNFNEKIQWLKLNDRNPLYIELVDKYRVRKFVEQTIGQEYLIPLVGFYEKVEDIDFEKLPEKFVLKCNHNSGGIVICKDKNKIDFEQECKKLEKCMKNNYYYWGREWPYKMVQRGIVCEKLMEDTKHDDLLDYKFMCFNGKVQNILVCSDRRSDKGLAIDFYDCNWEHLPFKRPCRNSSDKIDKPKNLKLMIELAERLAKNIPFVRVDFYEIDNSVYFGEMTFYPASGFEQFIPNEYDRILGDMININN